MSAAVVVAPAPRPGDVVRQICALMNAGLPARQARQMCAEQIAKLDSRSIEEFDLVWGLANRVGGPAVSALNRLAAVFDRAALASREVQLAFAAPQATARLVMLLPLLALVFGQLVGLNPLGSIFGSLLGALSVSLGLGLLVLGHWWSKRLLTSVQLSVPDPGAFLDCVAIGLQAGLPVEAARLEAEAAILTSWQTQADDQSRLALDEAVALSRSSGAAIVEILISSADRLRENLRFAVGTQIAKLAIRLMIPLGVAVLPAFVLLSIVPIAIGLLSNH